MEINYNNQELIHTRDSGMLIGIENVFRSEMNNWWKTRKWWLNALIWTAVVNGMLLLLLTSLPSEMATLDTALQLFTVFIWMGSSIGIIILMQDSIVGEKLSGTAEWVLSKPVSRSSFIVGKLVSNLISAFITMLLIPGSIAYIILASWKFNLVPGRFFLGILILLVNLTFFLTLTLMMGTLLSSRAGVIGVPIGFLFGQQYLSGLTSNFFNIFEFIPYALTNPTSGPPLSVSAILGTELWSTLPIYSSILAIVAFIGIAIKRFEIEEF